MTELLYPKFTAHHHNENRRLLTLLLPDQDSGRCKKQRYRIRLIQNNGDCRLLHCSQEKYCDIPKYFDRRYADIDSEASCSSPYTPQQINPLSQLVATLSYNPMTA